MASTPSITTIIVCAVVAAAAVSGILGGWYYYLKSRERRRSANGTSSSGVELSNSLGSSRIQHVPTGGQAKEISMDFQDQPSRQSDLLSPFTNARDPPYPSIPSQQEDSEEIRRPSGSRQKSRKNRDTPPPWRSVQDNDDYLNLSSLRHTETRETDHIDKQTISAPLKNDRRPSNSYPFDLPQIHYSPPSSSMPSPLETPQTSSTLLTSITEGPQFIYHSHLRPTAAANHLHAPPRHLPSSRPSSLLSSSADSIKSNSQYVNPAYAAIEKARKASVTGKRRRWALFGLGSDGGDDSASGSGWVIKGRSPELPSSAFSHDPTTPDSTEPGEESAEEVIAQVKAAQDGKRRPGPISIPHKPSPRAKASPKSKFSARPTHPASAGTPQLDTISDGPRWAPKIKSMRRPHPHPSPDPDPSPLSGAAEDGFPDGLPNVFGRGVMTDQYFVRERDDESFMSTPKEGKRRGAVRVDGRGRIVRA